MFTKAAEMLGVPCKDCVVIEDSAAGIAAAAAGGMKSVGIGSSEILGNADIVVPDTAELPALDLPK